jgi:gamma-glutamyltranspeptidase
VTGASGRARPQPGKSPADEPRRRANSAARLAAPHPAAADSARAAGLAAPHTAAVDAARAAWASGGNAIDMTVAAAVALNVVYPHQCALGGDLIALVRRPDGAVTAVLSAGAAPAAIPVEELRAAGERMPGAGPHAVTVPGVLAGWAALVDAGGKLPLAHHLEAAAALAADGVPVAPGLAHAIRDRHAAIAADPGLAALLLPDGRPLAAGDALVQPRLAETLRALAADGPSSLYGGAVGEVLVAGLCRLGGSHTIDDFATHEAELAAPLIADALGATWHVAPPPTQGATLLALLRAMDADAASSVPLAAVRASAAARDALLGDPRRGPIDVDGLIAAAARVGAAAPARAAGDTVAVSAASADGWAVCLLQSVYQTFGAAILEPETGIVLHNRGSAFSLVPGHPGELAPGARPPHTLCPAIATTPGGAVAAVGCQGGRAQPQVLAQIATAVADPGFDLRAALERPRWVLGARDIGYERETLLAEPGAAAPVAEAQAAGVAVAWIDGVTDLTGHAQVARVAPASPDLAATPDPPAAPTVPDARAPTPDPHAAPAAADAPALPPTPDPHAAPAAPDAPALPPTPDPHAAPAAPDAPALAPTPDPHAAPTALGAPVLTAASDPRADGAAIVVA